MLLQTCFGAFTLSDNSEKLCVDALKINIKISLDIPNYLERKVVYFDILNSWISLGFLIGPMKFERKKLDYLSIFTKLT